MRAYFRYPDGLWPNLLAFGYVLIGYAGGLALIIGPGWMLNILGVLLLAHAQVIAAYFIHEFAHGSVFRQQAANRLGGECMGWLTGSCYADFASLRHKHIRHHADRADIISFDFRQFLHQRPAALQRLVLVLEWLYIPAVELLMRVFVIWRPFLDAQASQGRRRVLTVLTLRTLLLIMLALVSLKALLLYLLAQVLMITILRFMDAYQHTYEVFAAQASDLPAASRPDRNYEQANTYSNLLSERFPLLNLLVLNFCYHNAHHAQPAQPWHRLAQLHQTLYGEQPRQVLPARILLRSFHQYRLARVFSEDYGVVGQGPGRADGFQGAVGVSFLTAV